MFCWHVLPTDPPGTKPYITWGSPDECPVCHPELYEPYGKPVIIDAHSGEPFTPEGQWIPKIIHCEQWLRKKVPMDPTRPLHTPIAEVRAQAPVRIDQYGEAWVVIDGVDTKIPNLKKAQAILAHQDEERKKIRAAYDELGLRDNNEIVTLKTEDGIEYEAELVPPSKTKYMTIGEFPFKETGHEGLLTSNSDEYDASDVVRQRKNDGLLTDRQLYDLTGITPPPPHKPSFFSRLLNIFRKEQ